MESIRSKFDESTKEKFTSAIQYDEARNLIGKSLSGKSTESGDPLFRWMTDYIPSSESETDETRWESASFIMGFPINKALKAGGGILLGERSSSHVDNNQRLLSCLLLQEYDLSASKSYFSSFVSFWQSALAYYQMTKGSKTPDLFSKASMSKHRNHFLQIASTTDKVSEEWHQKYGPSDPHWHVVSAAVDIQHQSRGLGTKLFERLHVEADQQNKSIYLACSGSRARNFFERLGYTVVGTETAEDPIEPKRICEVFILVRTPAGTE